MFDYLIATDASIDSGEVNDEENEDEVKKLETDGDAAAPETEVSPSNDGDDDDKNEELGQSSSSSSITASRAAAAVAAAASKAAKRSNGYGVSRGIDFVGVSFVINFDMPATSAAYTHRIGRTARGGANGTALSFVSISSATTAAADVEIADRDYEVLQEVRRQQPRLGSHDDAGGSHSGAAALAAIGSVPLDDPALAAMNRADGFDDPSKCQPAPLVFNMRELDSFRYRVEETIRSVTATAVQEYRAAEIKQEILNSSKLKSYFAENPDDLKVGFVSTADPAFINL